MPSGARGQLLLSAISADHRGPLAAAWSSRRGADSPQLRAAREAGEVVELVAEVRQQRVAGSCAGSTTHQNGKPGCRGSPCVPCRTSHRYSLAAAGSASILGRAFEAE